MRQDQVFTSVLKRGGTIAASDSIAIETVDIRHIANPSAVLVVAALQLLSGNTHLTVAGVFCCAWVALNEAALGDQYGFLTGGFQHVIVVTLLLITSEMIANPDLIQLKDATVPALLAAVKMAVSLGLISFGIIVPKSVSAGVMLVTDGLLILFV